MPDINLLPKELRDDDQKSSRKTQSQADYDLVYPKEESLVKKSEHKTIKHPVQKTKKVGWMARWRKRRQEARESSQYERLQKKKMRKHEATKVANQQSDSARTVEPKKMVAEKPERLLLPQPSILDRITIVLFGWMRPLMNFVRRLSQRIVGVLTPPPRGTNVAPNPKEEKSSPHESAAVKDQESDSPDDSSTAKMKDSEDKKTTKDDGESSEKSTDTRKDQDDDISSHDYDVNLIPKEILERQALAAPQRLLAGIMGIIFSCIIIGVAYGALFSVGAVQRTTITGLQDDLAEKTEELDRLSNRSTVALAFQKKLTDVKTLLAEHIYWTEFFDALEAVTLPNVSYTNFAMTGTNRLTISAIGTDYETVAEQLVAFNEADDFIASAEIYSASAEYDSDGLFQLVNFSITLEFVDGVFTRELR